MNYSDIIDTIANIFSCNKEDIKNFTPQKLGMTNHSYLFEINNNKYLFRKPGEGTNKIINRYNEAHVYSLISKLNISDEIIYIDPKHGYKISKYIENSRVCNPQNLDDVSRCMEKLRKLHDQKLKCSHEFNLFEQLEYYEKLLTIPSKYNDYFNTKMKILSLQNWINGIKKESVLSHVDPVADNFLLNDDETILIDWEYAAMQDPDIDIAMFCLYSLYDDEMIDKIIDIYYDNNCPYDIRTKIYAYLSIGGLVWSNWCEFKRQCGNEFNEYADKQYYYAKYYYEKTINRLKTISVDNAIILAAGTSSRFAPLSFENPKALLNVKGEPMIERLINQLQSSGINEIIVVTGYKAEKFEYLIDKFGIKIIYNSDFNTKNNYSSLYAVKDYLKNSYICCADNYYPNNPFLSKELNPFYSCVHFKYTDSEWAVDIDSSDRIIDVNIGGEDKYCMFGHVFFDESFSKKLIQMIEQIYNNDEYNSLLWEAIYLKNIDKLPLYIRRYSSNDIFEFDTLDELRLFDSSYIYNTRSSILKKLSIKHKCNESDIHNIEAIKGENNTATGFNYNIGNNTYTYYYNNYSNN